MLISKMNILIQGSILGSVLYAFYTSDLPCISGLTVAAYADDTAFILFNNSASQIEIKFDNNF